MTSAAGASLRARVESKPDLAPADEHRQERHRNRAGQGPEQRGARGEPRGDCQGASGTALYLVPGR